MAPAVPNRDGNIQSVASGTKISICFDSRVMLTILDTVCTKSVAGHPWFQSYYEMADALGIPLHVVDEVDQFQFGASRIYNSSFAVWCWFAIREQWCLVKVAIVPGPLPLLFSRPVLTKLGVQYDLAAQKLSLRALNVDGFDTVTSDTGHPALPASQFPENAPPTAVSLGFDDVWVPERAYMVAAAGFSGGSYEASKIPIFYPRKIPLEVSNMLSLDETIGTASFFSRWPFPNRKRLLNFYSHFDYITKHVLIPSYPCF